MHANCINVAVECTIIYLHTYLTAYLSFPPSPSPAPSHWWQHLYVCVLIFAFAVSVCLQFWLMPQHWSTSVRKSSVKYLLDTFVSVAFKFFSICFGSGSWFQWILACVFGVASLPNCCNCWKSISLHLKIKNSSKRPEVLCFTLLILERLWSINEMLMITMWYESMSVEGIICSS